MTGVKNEIILLDDCEETKIGDPCLPLKYFIKFLSGRTVTSCVARKAEWV